MASVALAHDDRGEGRAVVFLHGITNDRGTWAPVVDQLAGDFRCINVDLPGHGGSPRTGDYDVFSQTAVVASFLSEAGIEAPSVVGHSYGAFIATLLGTMAPVASIVNVDQELDTAAFKARIEPLEHRLRGDDFASAFEEFAGSLRPDLVPEQHRSHLVMRPDPEVVLSVWGTVFDSPADDLVAMVEPALATYPVPYLAIYGSSISAEERRLIDLIPQAEVEEWDGLGHFVQLADPDRTAARIAEFVRTRADG